MRNELAEPLIAINQKENQLVHEELFRYYEREGLVKEVMLEKVRFIGPDRQEIENSEQRLSFKFYDKAQQCVTKVSFVSSSEENDLYEHALVFIKKQLKIVK